MCLGDCENRFVTLFSDSLNCLVMFLSNDPRIPVLTTQSARLTILNKIWTRIDTESRLSVAFSDNNIFLAINYITTIVLNLDRFCFIRSRWLTVRKSIFKIWIFICILTTQRLSQKSSSNWSVTSLFEHSVFLGEFSFIWILLIYLKIHIITPTKAFPKFIWDRWTWT